MDTHIWVAVLFGRSNRVCPNLFEIIEIIEIADGFLDDKSNALPPLWGRYESVVNPF